MLVTRAYKTELDLNNEQVTACKRHAGAARFTYNWGLQVKQERYKATGASPHDGGELGLSTFLCK